MDDADLPPAAITAIRSALLAFYDAHARDLPWRRTRDPYAIWISEVMAQQTRIETVVPYYDRWLRRFPDVNALADAGIDDVLEVWQGLGYYSRARNLHTAARVVRERHGGTLPDSYAALRALPGVGDYTAGAVASIVFGQPEPAVDGNARRVLARLLDEPEPGAARLRRVAAALVPPERPGEFNQALMELGATVCTPRAPRCDACGLAAHCAARSAGTQADRPRRQRAARVPTFDIATLVLHSRDGRVLLQRRPTRGLLGGMWCFPGRELRDEHAAPDAAARHVLALARELTGHDAARVDFIGSIEHVFSHRRERYLCGRVELDASSSALCVESGAWIGVDTTGYPLPRAQQRIHALVYG